MNDGWMLWLFLAGLGIGVIAATLLLIRLHRDEEDISAAERSREATWISDTIERYGGVAPPSLVEEVLELHQAYLHDPRSPEDPYAEDATDPSSIPSAPSRGLPPPAYPQQQPQQPHQHPQHPQQPQQPQQQATPHHRPPPTPGAPDRSPTPR